MAKNKRGSTPETVTEIPQTVTESISATKLEQTENTTISIPTVEPVVEYQPEPEKIVIPINTKSEKEVIVVDKKLFYEMAYSLGAGYTNHYSRMSGVMKIGQMCGKVTQKECADFYTEITKFLKEKK